MVTIESAKNLDPTLYFQCFGGPRDGFKSGDLPVTLSGRSLTGCLYSSPMAEPHEFSLRAIYECTSFRQVDGFWRFEYRGMRGPNGEHLVADLVQGDAMNPTS